MRRARTLIGAMLLLLIFSQAWGQSVGLVLSGGGAKGCTHVGVIKALEENNIPIDYIAGTSMGSIVGALYAMGYTPEEMEQLLISKDFLTWLKGNIDEKSKFYFKEEEESPEFISFKLNISDSLIIKPDIPSSLLSPDQLNQACMYLFSQANTACGGDFDSLFVPFRCIATDVTQKGEFVHRNGDLGDAVRTSMSFPFVFKPIRVNTHLMVDGGIYNNFPLDVMNEELKADYIIGSNVSEGVSDAEDGDPIALLENLIIQDSKYQLPKDKGTIIDFHYKDVRLLDFDRAEELIQIGYDSTTAHIDEIKAKVLRSISEDSLNSKRFAFNQRKPQLLFKNVIIRGVKPLQQRFIAKTFHAKNNYFSYNSFRRNYFKLLSDRKIAEIIPHATWNSDINAYDLILDVRLNDHLKFGIGGNISSTTSNQLYISAKYMGIKRLSYDYCLDGQVGIQYKNAHFQARFDFPYQFPFCLKFIGDITHNSVSVKQNTFYETDIPMEGFNTEFYSKGKFCIPFLLKGEIDAGAGIAKIKNKYHGLFSNDDDTYDISTYNLGNVSISYRHNSLSNKQFATFGTKAKIAASYIFGKKIKKENIMIDSTNIINTLHDKLQWLQISAMIDHYIPIARHFSLGLMAEGVYSTHGLESNYMETLLIAPSFTPTTHSKMVFNTAFSANTYIAAGIKPIVRINDLLHVRLESYGYLPHKAISPNATFNATYDKPFSKIYWLGEISVVAQLKYITASIYANYYSYPKKNFNFGLNIGYLIFHDKFVE